MTLGTTPRSIWIVGQGHEADRHAAAWATLARVTPRRVAPDGIADRLAEHVRTEDTPLAASMLTAAGTFPGLTSAAVFSSLRAKFRRCFSERRRMVARPMAKRMSE